MKINKPYTNKEYADLAVYCNENGKVIEDKGDYLEAVNPPEPSDEENKAQVRAVRDNYMQITQNRIDRYRNQKELGIETTDTEEVFKRLLEYTQYLRDYPNGENWWLLSPLVFGEFVSLKTEKDENNANI